MCVMCDRIRTAGVWAAATAAAAGLLSGSAFAAADGGAKLPQLDIQTYPSQVFWLVVSFVVLYVLVSRVAVPRISEVLEERQERIADDLDKADTLQKDAARVQAEYEQALTEARTRASGVIREAQDAAARSNAGREAEARDKVAGMLNEAEARILSARDEALDNIGDVAREVAAEAVVKLIGARPAGDAVDRAVSAAAQDARQ